MNITRWYSESELIESIEPFIRKFQAKKITTFDDGALCLKALVGAAILMKGNEDNDLVSFIEDDLEEYGSLAYYHEFRGTSSRYVIGLEHNQYKMGEYSGAYDPKVLNQYKQQIWQDLSLKTILKIANGDPNIDAEFFSGEYKLKGTLKLAMKLRAWFCSFFEMIEDGSLLDSVKARLSKKNAFAPPPPTYSTPYAPTPPQVLPSGPSDQDRVIRIRKVLQVYTTIKKDTFRKILELDEQAFELKLLDWAIEFGFKINDEMILFDKADISGFLSSLESQYHSN